MRWLLAITALLWWGLASFALAQSPHLIGKIERQGIAVNFSLERLGDAQTNRAARFQTGDHVRFEFHVHDTTLGAPLIGGYPAAWIHPRGQGQAADAQHCLPLAQRFLSGSLMSRAALDLNVYYVLTLNADATVSVVDPLFGFGGFRLLDLISLPAPGYDWIESKDDAYVWLSMPEAHQLGRLDTTTWKLDTLEGGQNWQRPAPLSLQPDERYLWVGVTGGVAVFQAHPLRFVTRIATGATPREIIFSPNSRYAFVTLTNAHAVAVIDSRERRIVKTLKTGKRPVSLAYSDLAEAVYVSHEGDGTITVFDGVRHDIIATQPSEPGLGMVRITPDGRWALVINPATDRLTILDTSRHRIVQRGLVDPEPDQIVFSDYLAYIRHRGSYSLLMMTLGDVNIGKEGAPIPVVETVGGNRPPGQTRWPTPAPGITQAPGANAVLIANALDKAVYFYKEGMAAPMDQFNLYGKSPRAVIAVDRSLKERRQPGVYETVAQLGKPGTYDVVFFQDSPRILYCFDLTIAPIPGSAKDKAAHPQVTVKDVNRHAVFQVAQPANLRYQLEASHATQPIAWDRSEVNILITLASGLWRQRQTITPTADGTLALSFTPPRPGFYQVYLESRPLGLTFRQSHGLMYEVKTASTQ